MRDCRRHLLSSATTRVANERARRSRILLRAGWLTAWLSFTNPRSKRCSRRCASASTSRSTRRVDERERIAHSISQREKREDMECFDEKVALRAALANVDAGARRGE